MVSLAPIAILVVTQMVRWSGSFASLRYGAMRAGAALSSSAESTGPVLQAESLLVPAHDSLLVPLATTARLTAAVELASSDTDEKRV
jgi:hypothetical protein